jgi:hypothetical protein
VLVHEVTSWDDRRGVAETRRWGHTHVDEMIARAEQFTGEALVLVHRSLRHTKREALEVVRGGSRRRSASECTCSAAERGTMESGCDVLILGASFAGIELFYRAAQASEPDGP